MLQVTNDWPWGFLTLQVTNAAGHKCYHSSAVKAAAVQPAAAAGTVVCIRMRKSRSSCFPAAERSGERRSCTGGNNNNGIYNCSANFSCGAQVYVNSFPIARGRGITEGLLQLIETHDWRQMEADRSMNREDQWYSCKWQRPS